jgi:O-antigen/teichoic acid export membrane protein
MLYAKTNIIILSKLVTDQEMGFYMAALTLVENLYFIPTALLTSIFPAFSRLYGASLDTLKNAYIKISKYLIILSVAVSLGTIIVSEKIITIIFGSQFTLSASILNILIFLWVFNFFSNAQSIILWSIHKEKVQVIIMFIALITSVILNFTFIILFGIIGAAYAAVLTESLVVALITVVLWRLEFRYIPDLRILRLIFAGVGMVMLVNFLLPFNLIIAITAGAALYLGLLFILKIFDDDDIIYLKSMISRRPAQ